MLNIILFFLFFFHQALAQTPPEFEPPTKERLGVSFEHNGRVHPGARIPKYEANHKPSLDLKSVAEIPPLGRRRAKYLVLMIDLDVPRNGTTLPLLHWYQPDLIIKDNKNRALSVQHFSKRQKAKYIAPSPPPGSPHRYVQVLFEQPGRYSFPPEFDKYLGKKSEARLGFEIKEFIRAAGLGEPVAGSWFLVHTSEKERDDL